VWQPSEYDNITEITLRSSEVWTPQITLFNGDEGGLLADTQVTLTHDGHFRRMPPALYSAYCDLNMLNWPHDKQTCKLKIGSWGLKVILPDNTTDFRSWTTADANGDTIHGFGFRARRHL